MNVSRTQRKVLDVLAESGELSAFAISKAAKIAVHRLDPAFARLEESALIETRWEPPTRPPAKTRRLLYSLTEAGRAVHAELTREIGDEDDESDGVD